MTKTAFPSLSTLIPGELTVGEPDVAGPLAVFPLFGPPPGAEYVSYAEGSAHGVTVTELPSGASVNDLLVHNPLPTPVLLYEGEEVLGAQQNRTLDVAVLVAEAASLKVPVSCVEHGRWDGSRHGEAFAPSPQAAYPSLRAAKSRHARVAAAAGMEARADQGAVWADVAAKANELAAAAPTQAMSDIYESRRTGLDELVAAVSRRDGQLGAIAAIGNRFVVLDHVSRPDVYAALHGPLVSGYALDALSRAGAPAPSVDEARDFLARVLASATREHRAVGLGGGVGMAGARVAGTGLQLDGELVQLCAFAEEPGQPASATRIRRPSRRR